MTVPAPATAAAPRFSPFFPFNTQAELHEPKPEAEPPAGNSRSVEEEVSAVLVWRQHMDA